MMGDKVKVLLLCCWDLPPRHESNTGQWGPWIRSDFVIGPSP